ncbi:unnamed protein product [Paramecium pentaurelia]|uniref:Protein kinase domain-containing protein n=1 Tax=Paramecium pentaurelia TaxID=43138 RepID=A0A8S1SCD7_9CILI|nr:unnamed protein product [Paramecium pentaurelia]
MFSPPKVHPFEENYIQKVLMDIERSPLLQYEIPQDLQLFKSQSLLCDDDQQSPFQGARNLPLQRFNSEVFHDFTGCQQQIIGDNNKFLKSRQFRADLSKFSGDFEVIHQIGRGSKGVVYKVLSKVDGLYYAAKKVPLDDNIQTLTLDGQVQFNCCYQHQGFLYIIMEHCEYSLKQRLMQRVYESEIRQIIVDVCEALQNFPQPHLHIHGGNVLFSKQMKYKLSDYGYSNNTIHQAPEKIKSKLSDIYSLGILLMELMLEKELNQISSLILQKFDNLSYYSVSLKQQIKKMVSIIPDHRPDIQQLINFAKVHLDQELNLLQEQNAELQKQIDEIKPRSRRRIQSE